MKKTLVIGASSKPERYSYKAINMLLHYGHPVVAIGARKTEISGIEIQTQLSDFQSVHTVTMYVGPQRQPEFYDYIIGLKPQRVIFNPGTENTKFAAKLEAAGIEVLENCTLVMLSTQLF